MTEDNKLAEVNATLDRFAKLIEENAEQLRKDKEEFNRQLAEDRAKDEKRQEAWEKRFSSMCDQVGGQGNNDVELTNSKNFKPIKVS